MTDTDDFERAVYQWEIHLTYPFDSSHTKTATEFVEATGRDKAIQKAKENAGMDEANAYPVYKMEKINEQR